MTEQSVAPFIHGLYGRGARRRALFMLYRSLRYEPDEPVDGVVFLPLIARNRPRVPVGLPLSATFVDGTEVPVAAVLRGVRRSGFAVVMRRRSSRWANITLTASSGTPTPITTHRVRLTPIALLASAPSAAPSMKAASTHQSRTNRREPLSPAIRASTSARGVTLPNDPLAYTNCRLTKMPGAMRPLKYLILQESVRTHRASLATATGSE